jgi:hypothetical protein
MQQWKHMKLLQKMGATISGDPVNEEGAKRTQKLNFQLNRRSVGGETNKSWKNSIGIPIVYSGFLHEGQG